MTLLQFLRFCWKCEVSSRRMFLLTPLFRFECGTYPDLWRAIRHSGFELHVIPSFPDVFTDVSGPSFRFHVVRRTSQRLIDIYRATASIQ